MTNLTSELYPLKFHTIFKDKIWGGTKIRDILGKDFTPLPNCGETWEISAVNGNVSVVSHGNLAGKDLRSLIRTYKGALVGEKVYETSGEEFPLLVKFIDANDDLSVQVHPDDELAGKRHNSLGKTEMWYVFQADDGSSLISGFNQPMDKEKYRIAFENGEIMNILNREEVQQDDVYFLPAGRIHTIGKGLLIAEIQQTSDITYRIYDFDRVDDNGQQRELHTEEAIDAIDYEYYNRYKTAYEDKINEAMLLVECPYFTTNKLHITQNIERNFQQVDSFVIYVCMEGNVQIQFNSGKVNIKKGESVLVPACMKIFTLEPSVESKLLESFIE